MVTVTGLRQPRKRYGEPVTNRAQIQTPKETPTQKSNRLPAPQCAWQHNSPGLRSPFLLIRPVHFHAAIWQIQKVLLQTKWSAYTAHNHGPLTRAKLATRIEVY